jgi:putative Mg2+ transporter-C (MgtC) family protein
MYSFIDEIFTETFLGLTLSQSMQFFLPRVLVGTVCGFVVGLERQLKDRPVGIRTAVLVCVGSALYTSTALLLSHSMRAIGHDEGFTTPLVSDPGRIIAQIVSGVGFIGAGVIFKLNDRVAGITTASFIWAICAIGIIIGLGGYVISIVLTIGLVTSLVLMEQLERLAMKRVAKRRAIGRNQRESRESFENSETSNGQHTKHDEPGSRDYDDRRGGAA